MSRNPALDLVRGSAAVLVCAFHLRQAFFVAWGEAQGFWPWKFLFYLATGIGHQSVMLFFVLSGFFVGGSILRQGAGFHPGGYALARATRLYVVLLPALGFTFLVDLATSALAPDALAGRYQGVWHSGPVSGIVSSSPATLLGNLAFLQEILVPVYGSNGPLWSLMCEFWYYVLFPSALVAAGALPSRRSVRIAACLLVGASLFVFDARFWTGAGVWLLGVALHVLVERRWDPVPEAWRRSSALVALLGFLGVCVLNRVPMVDRIFGRSFDLVTGIASLVLLHRVVGLRPPRFVATLAVRLSDVSYSLYLVHFPVVVLLGGMFAARGLARLEPDAAGTALLAAGMCGLLALGTAFWACFERKTDSVRKWAAKAMLPKRRMD